MDPKSLREYRERWKIVNAVEIDERRHTPVSVRWTQLNYLFGMAASLGILPEQPTGEIEAVRQRWNILKGLG